MEQQAQGHHRGWCYLECLLVRQPGPLDADDVFPEDSYPAPLFQSGSPRSSPRSSSSHCPSVRIGPRASGAPRGRRGATELPSEHLLDGELIVALEDTHQTTPDVGQGVALRARVHRELPPGHRLETGQSEQSFSVDVHVVLGVRSPLKCTIGAPMVLL